MMSVMSSRSVPLLWPNVNHKCGATGCEESNHNCGTPADYSPRMQKSKAALALADNVRRLMDDRGWKTKDLAKATGIAKSAINYLLGYKDASSRHATLETVEIIANEFKVAPHLLLVPGFAAGTVANVEKFPGGKKSATAATIDAELAQWIFEGLKPVARGFTARDRAALAQKIYESIVEGHEARTKAVVLRIVRSSGA